MIADRIIEDNIEDKEVPDDIAFENWTSTNKNHSSTSSHTYQIAYEAGQSLCFDWNVSSESGYDHLQVSLGGSEILKKSGNESGTYTKQFTTAGSTTLVVKYTKDNSNSSGSDEGKISNVKLTYKNVVQDNSLTLGSNGSSPFFSSCLLETVYIGGPIKYSTSSSYGYSPFYRNASLKSVSITDTETEIYDNEFYGCTALKDVTIGDGVKKIGKYAFSGCSSLESFSFGSSTETIGEEAFSDCTALTKLTTCAATPPVCGSQALDDINKWECTLHVPVESVALYQAADQWKEFFFIEGTSIHDIKADKNILEAAPRYNLSGQRVTRNAKGIVIQNGKKILVK